MRVPSYKVMRDDGAPADGQFVLLRIDTEWQARRAAMAYVQSIRGSKPEVAEHLEGLVLSYANPAEKETLREQFCE